MKKRLIDASHENAKLVLGDYPYYPDEIWKFAAMAERFPTVDAVEVVRCRECRYWDIWETTVGIANKGWCLCHGVDGMESDDFCSYGERKYNV